MCELYIDQVKGKEYNLYNIKDEVVGSYMLHPKAENVLNVTVKGKFVLPYKFKLYMDVLKLKKLGLVIEKQPSITKQEEDILSQTLDTMDDDNLETVRYIDGDLLDRILSAKNQTDVDAIVTNVNSHKEEESYNAYRNANPLEKDDNTSIFKNWYLRTFTNTDKQIEQLMTCLNNRLIRYGTPLTVDELNSCIFHITLEYRKRFKPNESLIEIYSYYGYQHLKPKTLDQILLDPHYFGKYGSDEHKLYFLMDKVSNRDIPLSLYRLCDAFFTSLSFGQLNRYKDSVKLKVFESIMNYK
jgi:hypothetical protein